MPFRDLLLFFYQRYDHICRIFKANLTGVQADIVVFSSTPGAARIVLLVHCAALILFLQSCLGTLFRLTVKPHDPVGSEIQICMDEYIQAVLPVLQNIVSITAHNHAGTLFRQLQDHAALNAPEEIVIAKLKDAIEDAVSNGFVNYITGMSRGVDYEK